MHCSLELPSPKGSEPSNSSFGKQLMDARGQIRFLLGPHPLPNLVRKLEVEGGMGAALLWASPVPTERRLALSTGWSPSPTRCQLEPVRMVLRLHCKCAQNIVPPPRQRHAVRRQILSLPLERRFDAFPEVSLSATIFPQEIRSVGDRGRFSLLVEGWEALQRSTLVYRRTPKSTRLLLHR